MRFHRTLPLLVLALLALLCGACARGGGDAQTATQYHCPMHPDYVSDKPGDCPICGMRLVPIVKRDKTAAATPADRAGSGNELTPAPGQVPGLAPVEESPEALRIAGVQIAVAERKPLTLSSRAAGLVTADESRVRHIHTKISGWVEKLYVNTTGQPVRAGQPLLAIYSPQLLATQEEYLRAREAAARFSGSSLPEVREGGQDLLAAARRRLELFDVPHDVITRLERTGKAQRTITLTAPVSGYVTGKEVFEGMEIDPGIDLFTVTDLSQVWVEADFYEYESSALRLGQRAVISLPYDPGAQLAGRVSFIYPVLDPQSRTLKVRIEFPNPGLVLKPGMYVDVIPETETRDGVVVPDSAVVDTGLRQVVFVRQGDTFEPREVRVGTRAEGQAMILQGLQEGEQVAVKANFLLDSESRLRAALSGAAAPRPTAPKAAPHQHGGGGQ